MLAGLATGKFLHLLLHVLLTRKLSLEEYGMYALAYSFFIICTRISLMGIPVGILKFCSAHNATYEFSRTKGTIRSGYSIIIFSAVIICTVLLCFSKTISYDFFNEPNIQIYLIAFILFIPAFNLTRASQAVVRAYKMIGQYSVLKEVLFPLFLLLFAFIFLNINNNLYSVIYAFGAALALTFLINTVVVSRIYSKIKNNGQIIYTPFKLIRFSLPVFVESVSYLLLNQMSKIMIGFFQVSENVGIFNAAMNLGALLVIFLNCIDGVFAPYISELNAKNEFSQIKLVFKTTTRWIFILTVPLFLIYVLFSKDILSIFGPQYITGCYVLMILAAGYTINSITGSVTFIIQMSGKQDIEIINIAIAVFVNLGLNYFLIPVWGIIGAALATGCSVALLNIIRLLEVYYFFRMQPYDIKYIKPILSVLGATAIIYLISGVPVFQNIFWIIKVVIFSLSYFFIHALLKFEPDDVKLVSDFFNFRKR